MGGVIGSTFQTSWLSVVRSAFKFHTSGSHGASASLLFIYITMHADTYKQHYCCCFNNHHKCTLLLLLLLLSSSLLEPLLLLLLLFTQKWKLTWNWSTTNQQLIISVCTVYGHFIVSTWGALKWLFYSGFLLALSY